MKIAITGFANSGKTTIFNALTRQKIETTAYPTMGGDPHMGTVKVPDPRIDKLSAMFRPKKTTHATVEYVDYIGLTKDDPKQNRKVFDLIQDADTIVHVVRAFEDDSVPHPMGGVDAARDAGDFELELIFGDMELVEKRLERMSLAEKKGKKQDERERALLIKCKEVLGADRPLRDVEFTPDERMAMRHLQFLSNKPEIILINVAEKDIADAGVAGRVAGGHESPLTRALSLCGKIEMEISELPPEEARAFLDDLGIAEPALDRLIHVSYDLLGLASFFTVGEDEVRAWTIRKGDDAVTSAGKVHTDIQRGFIRAEVVSYDDLMACGGLSEARGAGKLRLEGKTYEVKDGDIINFRFNI